MNVRDVRLVVVETTPGQLRHVADLLEKQWAAARIGDDVPSHTIHEAGLEIRFVLDQEAKYDEERYAELKGAS